MTILKEAGTLSKKEGGRFKIQIVTPGVGSSGTYPQETIEAAGRDKIFGQGLHMYLDHATEAQDWAKPEGSLRDLVGVLDEDAHWDAESGGLVAEARIYSHWRPILEEMKDDIGVSIRASGEVREDAGQRVITKLVEARSVDFVTKAGRGGKVMEVLESARLREGINDETRQLLQKVVRATHGDRWCYVTDHTDTAVWFILETDSGDTTYEQTYIRNGITISLTGEPTEVVPTTVYVPKTTPAPAGNGNQESEQQEAAEMANTNTDTSRVDEADSKKPNPFTKGGDSGGSGGGGGNSNETEVEKLRRENGELKAEVKRLKAGKAKEARRTEVAGIVEEAFENIDAPTAKSDLIEKLTESESEKDTLIAEAKKRADEIHNLGGGNGQVRGLGESRPANTTEADDTPITFADLEALKGA